jgi:hypothetical protein
LAAARVVLLDAPEATPVAVMAVRALQDDFATRWIPTVLLTDAASSKRQPWIHLQRRLGSPHLHAALPRSTQRALPARRNAAWLSARASELIGN